MSGEANIMIDRTGFTVGCFPQPPAAKGLTENSSNIEKGLCQRLLWLLSCPTPVPCDELQAIDSDFTASIGE